MRAVRPYLASADVGQRRVPSGDGRGVHYFCSLCLLGRGSDTALPLVELLALPFWPMPATHAPPHPPHPPHINHAAVLLLSLGLNSARLAITALLLPVSSNVPYLTIYPSAGNHTSLLSWYPPAPP